MALINFDSTPTLVLHPKERKEMLSILPDGRVRINSSSLALLQECMRKAKYALFDGWSSQDESPATLFGSAIHEALAVYYTAPKEERDSIPKLEELQLIGNGYADRIDNLYSRCIRTFVDRVRPLAALPDDDKRSINNGIWILHEYFKTYKDDPYVAYVDDKGPFIERDFTLDLTPQIQVFGRIDFVFQHTVTGELLPGDHKTTSSLGFGDSSYYDRDRPNHQYSLYMLGAKRVFGIQSENFLVNVIGVKSKPKTARAKGAEFPRQITKRTEEDFAELEMSLSDAVLRFLAARETGAWPQGGVEVCNGKYGPCPYKAVCAAPISMRETMLKNKFNRRENGTTI